MAQPSKIRAWLNSKVLTVVAIALIALLALAFFRDKVRQEDLSSEIDRKQETIAELSLERVKLAEIIDALESADYIEREARLRLGLVRPGEQVVSVPENARPQAASTTVRLLEPRKSNASLWFEYFFGE